jgi:hypothetical protein
VDSARCRLKIGKDVFREKLDDVDERIGGSDSELRCRRARSDRGEEEDGGIFRFPVFLRVCSIGLTAPHLSASSLLSLVRENVDLSYVEIPSNVADDDTRNLCLELLHEGTDKVRGSLTARPALHFAIQRVNVRCQEDQDRRE